jgi:hypothetical protein
MDDPLLPNAGDLNLSEVWNGLYSYPHTRPPVHFLAELSELDGWLAGVIEERSDAGDDAGSMIGATLQGRRTARSVMFLKTYDRMSRFSDAVQYQGELNGDATEIEGRWTTAGWSGTFLMIRSGAGEEAITRSVRRTIAVKG